MRVRRFKKSRRLVVAVACLDYGASLHHVCPIHLRFSETTVGRRKKEIICRNYFLVGKRSALCCGSGRMAVSTQFRGFRFETVSESSLVGDDDTKSREQRIEQ